ncbi:MAG: DUF1016 family protein [Nanoarchaeota archaeon]|nr:DUF1016 family protein [Nanoarchaeota archaeon]MBU1704770.1 DUF1016 family protein [Nanoarchaeota archaeon]
MTKQITVKNYKNLLGNISSLLEDGRKRVIREVNNIIVNTYWNIGKQIVEFEQEGKEKAEYGQRLLKTLGHDLSLKYGKGFSWRNLLYMRKFYLIYPKLQTLSAKLSWSHYSILLSIDHGLKRDFYEIESIKNKYSVRELKRQIDSALFERLALSKDKKGIIELSRRGQIIENAEDLIKDPYVLEFLNIPESERLTETKLETNLIRNLSKFLLELGRGFSFVDRQYRITMNNEHHYVDLVFYNIQLKCYVLIDLKVRKFKHIDAGQMNFYLNYFKNEINSEGDKDPIGIILCLDKDKVYADYVLGGLNNKVFASKYKLRLPSEKELKEELEKEKRRFLR